MKHGKSHRLRHGPSTRPKRSSIDSKSPMSDNSLGAKCSASHNSRWRPFTSLAVIAGALALASSCVLNSHFDLVHAFTVIIGKGDGDVYPNDFKLHNNGGWREASPDIIELYNSSVCNIDRVPADSLTHDAFERIYRHRKPVIVTFTRGADAWIDSRKWTVASLRREYGTWEVVSGKAREIVRRGGSGYVDSTFSEFVDRLMSSVDDTGESLYVFDRDFYNSSRLPDTLHPPTYFSIQDGLDDSIFFLGGSGSGVSFHRHADAWNGVIYGRKRWFLYPEHTTPPGGVHPGFTQREWLARIYPGLPADKRPWECIQEAGEILYLPEGLYHGTVNLGDTVAIGIQKKEAVTVTQKILYQERELVARIRGSEEGRRRTLMQKQLTLILPLLQLTPESSEVHMKLGHLYSDLGDLQKARHHLATARTLDPFFVVATLGLAGVSNKLGEADQADDLYRECLRLSPSLWDVYAQYGGFLLSRKRYTEAASMFKRGAELEPATLAFWDHLRYAQQMAGNRAAAMETMAAIERRFGDRDHQ